MFNNLGKLFEKKFFLNKFLVEPSFFKYQKYFFSYQFEKIIPAYVFWLRKRISLTDLCHHLKQ